MVRGLGLRLFLTAALVLALVSVALVTLGFQVNTLRSETRSAHHSEQVLVAATNLDELQDEMVAAVNSYLISRDQASLGVWRKDSATVPTVGQFLISQVLGTPDEDRARTLVAGVNSYLRDVAEPVLALAASQPVAARALAVRLEQTHSAGALRAKFEPFLAAATTAANTKAKKADDTANVIIALFGIRIGGSFLVIVGIMIFLQWRIVVPIRRVSLAAERLARGEPPERLPTRGSDEVTRLGRSFNSMAASIERQRSEHEDQNRDLERLATVLRAVLDSTIDGILLTDLEGNVQLANRPLLRFGEELGIPGEGTAVERLLAIRHKMREEDRYVETMERLGAHPEDPSADEFEVANPYRVFVGYTAPVRDESGALIGRIWTLRDVTQERQLDRLKEEFVATVSHELRTPLTSMMGFLEMLREGEAGQLTAEQDRFLAIVYRSSERLQRLVGDLLFVARLDASGIQLQPTELRLDELVRDAVEVASALARAGEIALSVESSPPEGIMLRADPERLAQLVGNLISNALKFTRAGGRVQVRTFVDGEQAVIEVEDNGIGIPLPEQGRIFERFFRSSAATEQAIPGTGLGLVISRAIAEAHAGRISVVSEPGQGTTFRVELPFVLQFGDAALGGVA
jgi:signal transduction histidine kinase